MNNSILDREGLSDKKFIDKLTSYVESILDSKKTRLIAYFGLKKYIETHSEVLSEIELAPEVSEMKSLIDNPDATPDDVDKITQSMVNFDDRKADRMHKFSKDLVDLLADLDKIRKELEEMGVDVKAEEKKYVGNSSKVSVESIASGD